jgi:hypothetical protein
MDLQVDNQHEHRARENRKRLRYVRINSRLCPECNKSFATMEMREHSRPDA